MPSKDKERICNNCRFATNAGYSASYITCAMAVPVWVTQVSRAVKATDAKTCECFTAKR